MTKRILLIQGHPDPRGDRFGHALAAAYAKGAETAGHDIRLIDVARIDFPLLRSKEDWESATPVESIRDAQAAILRAGHLVFFYPLWMGTMPALLKGFLEQALRPGFAIGGPGTGEARKKPLTGKTAHIVITMGMPAFFYRWYFRAHSLKSLERNILHPCGVRPVKESLIGLIDAKGGARRHKWLARMQTFGREGK